MTVALLCGAVFGVGLKLVLGGLFPAPPPLAEGLERLSGFASVPPRTTGRSRVGGLAADLGLDRLVGVNIQGDLRLLGQTAEFHLARRMCSAGVGLLAGPALVGVILAMGGSVPLAVPTWVSLLLAAVGFVLPVFTVRQQAAARRRSFRHAFSAFLDVVALALAGGQGVETALWAGARAGDGWAFSELRSALERAALVGETPWAALDRLGGDLQIAELREFAAAVSLAGEQGAKVAASVIARAESLRSRGLAELEADANAASERMAFPTVLLLCGFLLFLTYPAVMGVLTQF